MPSDRFHKAARDGLLNVLKEASKRDINAKDATGMTPVLWAAFEGRLDILRFLIERRRGDPDKSDLFGYSALHFAAAKGHMQCLDFLIKCGVNIYAMDNRRNTAKDLAEINNREDIVQYLETAVANLEGTNEKKAKIFKETALRNQRKKRQKYIKTQRRFGKLPPPGPDIFEETISDNDDDYSCNADSTGNTPVDDNLYTEVTMQRHRGIFNKLNVRNGNLASLSLLTPEIPSVDNSLLQKKLLKKPRQLKSGNILVRPDSDTSDMASSSETDEEDTLTRLERFLKVYGLQDYYPIFQKEKIDWEAFMILTETDLKSLELPLGPFRKLVTAIEEYKTALGGN